MHIETQQNGNPHQLLFLPHLMLLDEGSLEFESKEKASSLPLVAALFEIPGVRLVKIGTDFILVTKQEDIDWGDLENTCLAVIEAELAPLVSKDSDGSGDYSKELVALDATILGGLLLS